jgi:hypothetical protein
MESGGAYGGLSPPDPLVARLLLLLSAVRPQCPVNEPPGEAERDQPGRGVHHTASGVYCFTNLPFLPSNAVVAGDNSFGNKDMLASVSIDNATLRHLRRPTPTLESSPSLPTPYRGLESCSDLLSSPPIAPAAGALEADFQKGGMEQTTRGLDSSLAVCTSTSKALRPARSRPISERSPTPRSLVPRGLIPPPTACSPSPPTGSDRRARGRFRKGRLRLGH